MPKWISVKDRLPDKTGSYIVWDSPYCSSTKHPTEGWFDGEQMETSIASDWSNITHWMEWPDEPS